MRADFKLMKDLAQITHTDAGRKVAECRNLLDVFDQNEKCKKKMEEWQLGFKPTPIPLQGYKFAPGNLLMGSKPDGSRNMFDIEQSARDIDRKIQDRMYSQVRMDTWGIFHGDRDAQVAKQFITTLKQAIGQFGFEAAEP